MIQSISSVITYMDGREPREFHKDYVGALSFCTVAEVFGDDFWKLLVMSVLPHPNQSNIDLIKDFIMGEISKCLP